MAVEKTATLDANGLAKSSGSMMVYNFNIETGEYTGSSLEFLAQGVGIPAHSSFNAPPACESGKVCLFRDGGWQQITDHRGETVYNIETGEAFTLLQPGDYPDGCTPLKPVTIFDKWDGSAWVTDQAAQLEAAVTALKAEKSQRISEVGSITQTLQTQLMLGIITDPDKALLLAWMEYLQAVQAVDVSATSEINWPSRPEN